jgi:hypothetical protein
LVEQASTTSGSTSSRLATRLSDQMSIRIEFESRQFDIHAEPPNPYNQTPGQSFLAWLRPELVAQGYVVGEPGTEDWGWYLEVKGRDERYVIGASAMPDKDGIVEWTVHLWRTRSVLERLQGKGRPKRTDPLPKLVERLVREDAGATEIDIAEDVR